MLETILGLGAGALILLAIIWWLPIILIARSDKTTGGEKIVWILLVLCFSWFSWILYMLIAPVHRPESRA
jgi:hypothetical protein